MAAVTKCNPYFVDIGAFDGINTSNTLTLEEQGWTGICVEANSEVFSSLVLNRPKAIKLNVAAAAFDGHLNFSGFSATTDTSAPSIACAKLDTILLLADAPYEIGYLSLDIEGMEPEVLAEFNFNKYQINLATIEHNLYLDGPRNKDLIFQIMSDNGFVRTVDNAPCLDSNPAYYMQPYEDWYVNRKMLPSKN